jgi:hypothetical protein
MSIQTKTFCEEIIKFDCDMVENTFLQNGLISICYIYLFEQILVKLSRLGLNLFHLRFEKEKASR